MVLVRDLAKNLRSLNIRDEVPHIIERTKQSLIDYNKDQLLHGLTSEGQDGSNIRGYKSFDYAVFKNAMNSLPEFGVPDLRLTGAFYSGIKVTVNKTTYEMYSTDSKAGDLENKYTIYIYGVTGKNLSEYANGIFWQQFSDYITKKTGLIFS